MAETESRGQSAEDIVAMRAELDRLRAENERLREADTARPRSRARTNWAIVLVVIGALVLALAPAAVWLRNIVFDTDKWVTTVAPLAQDRAIQAAVAEKASSAFIARLDAEQRIKDFLPDQYGLDRFAPVLASSVESAIRTQTAALTRSDQFAKIWEEINRTGHRALIASIRGREGAVSVQGGTFTLDTGLLIDKVKSRLEGRGLGFVANIPTASVDREVVLYQSSTLAALGPVLDGIQALAYLIPGLALVLIAGAFALAVNRQRVAVWLGVALTLFGILPLQLLYFSQYAVVRRVEQAAAVPSAAAQSAFTIVFRDLITADKTVVFLGIAIIVAAALAGPSRWAVALRTGMSGGLAAASSHLELGAFGAWVHAHKKGLRLAGFVGVTLVLLILPAPRTISTIVWLAVLLVVWLVTVEFLGGPNETESVAETGLEPEADLGRETEASSPM